MWPLAASVRSSASGLARAAALAVATVVGMAAAAISSALAEPPSMPPGTPEPPRFVAGTLRVTSPPSAAGSVFLHWEGTIAAPMAEQIERVYEAFAASRRRFVLVLNTGGGSVTEGEKVIALLRRIKRTHTLDTSVGPGARCGSMCLPLYLQGDTRFGARSSAWLFHEVTRRGSGFGKLRRVEGSQRRLIDAYWIPAGVSRPWIERMLQESDNHDWWQTGAELIADRAGIITRPIENRRPRRLEIEQMMPPAGQAGAKAAPDQRPGRREAPWSAPPSPSAGQAPAGAPPSMSPPTGLPVSGALPPPAAPPTALPPAASPPAAKPLPQPARP